MSIEQNNSNFETTKNNKDILLEELSNEISKSYWIEKSKTQELIKFDTSKWLEQLKLELAESWSDFFDKLKNQEQEKLFLILKWAQESIESQVHFEIMTLKDDIEKNLDINEIKNEIESFLPEKLINTAKNPKLIHEHILWFALWSANSIYAWLDGLYNIWKWIIQSPYHIYLIVKWEAKIDSFKNI